MDEYYTWCHNMVPAVLYILSFLQSFNPAANIYVEMPNHSLCESPSVTIPPHARIIGTTTRSDFFVIDDKCATILELTVP